MRVFHIFLSAFAMLVVFGNTASGDLDFPTCTYAELYFASVSGRIGRDINIRPPDKTQCSDKPNSRYRQMDGKCNHRKQFGSTFLPVKRYLKPHYHDKYGREEPRRYSVTGLPLPSPRLVSYKIHPDQNIPSKHTLLVMQMGQLLDHDITSAPVRTEGNSSIKCCGVPRSQQSRECFTISVPQGDPRFKDCMEFKRSEPYRDEEGFMIYPREQMNALTSFVDGSAIYGNDVDTMQQLRTDRGKGALLKTQRVKGKTRLPQDTKSDCLAKSLPYSYCQLAGDIRVNEQPGLSSIHLIFHMEHNKIVKKLARGILNSYYVPATENEIDNFVKRSPNSVKEHLFQEARKILTGIFQKIVYCEWLPIVIGPRLIQKFQLGCKRRFRYEPFVDPRIANVFLTAAFRFGHTMIPNKMSLAAGEKQHKLKDMFMIPDFSLLFHESIMEGLTKSRAQSYDRFVSSSVSSHLFETQDEALDLVALNIQRGRDHGIPSYYHWRKYYHLKRFIRADTFGKSIGRQLMKLYRNVLDIDLFTGGILEPPVPGGLVGETFAHILGNQFSDLKYGDAYFFLINKQTQGFTNDQLDAIRRVSFSRIVCENSDMAYIQENPFRLESFKNPLVRCQDLPDLDVTPWMFYF